ncbi:MAG TPA: IucA/IucC family siderophore biosynthesis protein [Cellvibrio sp.]|nr:IucA/IucC family siderophore biosynthesis protein [Cellvibrio sp.]
MNQFNFHQPESAVAHLSPEVWALANRHLACKALSEFSHEQILSPKLIEASDGGWALYQVQTDEPNCSYIFKAKKMYLRHWRIEKESIERVVDGTSVTLDALVLINDFKKTLGIVEEKLPIYLDEISSTLYGAAYKMQNSNIPCSELVDADYQTFESSMTEGHPGFVANNGRIGFDAYDYHAYAPETGSAFNIIWLAVHRDHAEFASIKDIEYFSFIQREIGEELFEHYMEKLASMGLNSDDYYFMPAHPWQWYTKLSIAFAAYVATRKIVPLGISTDAYVAQQSIRTYFNKSSANKSYVKTSLSILNMGFMRGLSPYYMKGTPAINTVLQGIISNDKTLNQLGFSILREIASIGFRNYYYESALTKDSPYKKMFSALWRESPMPMLQKNERLMTMTALLHVDYEGKALIAELIQRSGLSAEAWLARYFDAFLKPLLHCFYAHDLVFMPHCENLIVVLDGYLPKRVFMKDLAEECVILNKDAKVPEDAARMVVDVPEDYKLLGIFIDVFDGVFRFMSHILEESGAIEEEQYWRLVAQCAQGYQAEHPELNHKFQRYDFFAPTFMHSCLNRLQLKNNLQMINLADPASSLIMAEPLGNPVAQFANEQPAVYREKEAAC